MERPPGSNFACRTPANQSAGGPCHEAAPGARPRPPTAPAVQLRRAAIPGAGRPRATAALSARQRRQRRRGPQRSNSAGRRSTAAWSGRRRASAVQRRRATAGVGRAGRPGGGRDRAARCPAVQHRPIPTRLHRRPEVACCRKCDVAATNAGRPCHPPPLSADDVLARDRVSGSGSGSAEWPCAPPPPGRCVDLERSLVLRSAPSGMAHAFSLHVPWQGEGAA